MDDFNQQMESASDALAAIADGPGQDAAASLEAAFSQAGASIEASLSQAARSGELDFAQMARSVLADLASIAAEAALARAGIGTAPAPMTVNVQSLAGGGNSAVSAKDVSKAIAKAAAIGRRFA
ncbi:phage tail tape measure C-terminal domain-containing protein [Henriciella marina]|uniref:phage tail tape measure C-terminal domain-containing protein n=1 Tax=Henriciella marina TaxID=453851 RepID=UPI00036C87E1|nr:phage tail tape measure C-terminal domain-containing protein [Henriciella marina]